MSLVIKTYMGIFLILLSLLTMLGTISMCIDVVNARDFHNSVLTQIQEANFAPSVLMACQEAAVSRGYQLHIDDTSQMSADKGKKGLVEVRVGYELEIPLFQLKEQHEIYGIAR